MRHAVRKFFTILGIHERRTNERRIFVEKVTARRISVHIHATRKNLEYRERDK